VKFSSKGFSIYKKKGIAKTVTMTGNFVGS
jgi:hypothetical protein